jgi:hypothetical protein
MIRQRITPCARPASADSAPQGSPRGLAAQRPVSRKHFTQMTAVPLAGNSVARRLLPQIRAGPDDQSAHVTGGEVVRAPALALLALKKANIIWIAAFDVCYWG